MIVHQYRFLDALGCGSFGEVWKVEICKPGPRLGLQFAAKISHYPATSDEVAIEMVDMTPILSMPHPNILKLYVGEGFVDDRLLLLLELADYSLLDRSRLSKMSGPTFSIRELIIYISQVAAALDFLHEKGLFHGGINPSDILILNGQAKISDPGSSILPHHRTERFHYANYRKFICMSPDCKAGNRSKQSDQFALAATYAWIRLGRPALDMNGHIEELLTTTEFSHIEKAIILKALSPDPINRFRSCLEFAESLAHINEFV